MCEILDLAFLSCTISFCSFPLEFYWPVEEDGECIGNSLAMFLSVGKGSSTSLTVKKVPLILPYHVFCVSLSLSATMIIHCLWEISSK